MQPLQSSSAGKPENKLKCCTHIQKAPTNPHLQALGAFVFTHYTMALVFGFCGAEPNSTQAGFT
jgi:hypothetical protein